jgi:hypothetical protein
VFVPVKTRVTLIKHFGVNLHTLFESFTFKRYSKIMVTLMQWSSLPKSLSKFMPKKFYETNPRVRLEIKVLENVLHVLARGQTV